VVRLVVAGGSLTRRPKRSLRCLLVEVAWQINVYLTYLPVRTYLPVYLPLSWRKKFTIETRKLIEYYSTITWTKHYH